MVNSSKLFFLDSVYRPIIMLDADWSTFTGRKVEPLYELLKIE